VRFYIGGNTVNRPEQLRKLPLELYRSQDYPGQPAMMADAAQRYLNGEPVPTYVPARMMYTRWTSPNMAFGSSTVAMLQALKQSRDVQTNLQNAAISQGGNVPVGLDFYESADMITGSQLPSLQRLSQQDYDRTPLARNALPLGSFLSADAVAKASGLQGVRGTESKSSYLVPMLLGGYAVLALVAWKVGSPRRRRSQ